MQQGLGIAVQVSGRVVAPHALLLVVQGYKERRPVDRLQGTFVDTGAEVLLSHVGPRNP